MSVRVCEAVRPHVSDGSDVRGGGVQSDVLVRILKSFFYLLYIADSWLTLLCRGLHLEAEGPKVTRGVELLDGVKPDPLCGPQRGSLSLPHGNASDSSRMVSGGGGGAQTLWPLKVRFPN